MKVRNTLGTVVLCCSAALMATACEDKSAEESLDDVGEEIKEGAEDTAEGLGLKDESPGEEFKEGAEDVGDEIEDTADDTADAVKD